MENITLKINGMKCTGCSQRLEKVLNNTDGISSASVDFEKKEAIVSYDSNVINLNGISETVSDCGFEVEK